MIISVKRKIVLKKVVHQKMCHEEKLTYACIEVQTNLSGKDIEILQYEVLNLKEENEFIFHIHDVNSVGNQLTSNQSQAKNFFSLYPRF